MQSIICTILFLSSLVSVANTQNDCIQSIDHLDQNPIRTDTLVEINPDTHREKAFLSQVFIELRETDDLGMDTVVRKARKTIYYIRKDDCFLIQRIERPLDKLK